MAGEFSGEDVRRGRSLLDTLKSASCRERARRDFAYASGDAQHPADQSVGCGEWSFSAERAGLFTRCQFAGPNPNSYVAGR